MKYTNAKQVLPGWLLKELQQYVQRKIVYVPGENEERTGWGQANGTKEKYIKRNNEIIKLYKNGEAIYEIALKYHLSEYSIRKIVSGRKELEVKLVNKQTISSKQVSK